MKKQKQKKPGTADFQVWSLHRLMLQFIERIEIRFELFHLRNFLVLLVREKQVLN